MGWRSDLAREEQEAAFRRSLPLSQRYAWRRIVVTLLCVAAFIVAVLLRRQWK